MKPFIYLDHTADMKFQAYGKSLDAAFGNAALAMTNFLSPVKKIRPMITKEIAVEAPRIDTLLYVFLEEILFLMDTEAFLACKVKKIKISQLETFSLQATVLGDSNALYEVKGDIKAITYSDMLIKEEKGGWMVQVVVDI